MITGCLGARALIVAANSSPFMLGIAKSVITTSNLPESKVANASFALLAVSTVWPSKFSIIFTASQTNGSSSTTRMRFFEGAGTVAFRFGFAKSYPPRRQKLVFIEHSHAARQNESNESLQ